ncbi:MAG: CAP domain-containing protein [Gammaproteobacteria bacterium]|nr:CAP domain-containing protein [Gammaproteobacteria bacterium]
MSRTRSVWALLALAGLAAGKATASATDALSAVQVLREGGCGGIMPAMRALQHELALDAVARQWAEGLPLAAAAERGGYPALATSGLHVTSTDGGILELMRRSACRTVTGQGLRALGVFRRGSDSWIVMTSDYRAVGLPVTASRSPPAVFPPAAALAPAAPPVVAPSAAATPLAAPRSTAPAVLASEALQLVNEVRSRGTRCGQHAFGPAPPLSLSGTLGTVAFGHAADMADHDYFEHRDLNGQSPADRVRAAGYREKLVGENIAYGPKSVEEVVQGWLDSPGHCENIMDPRFAEMGIASASGRTGRHGLYWVQVFAEPQA